MGDSKFKFNSNTKHILGDGYLEIINYNTVMAC